MIKVILTKGLPASGKSTWAKKIIEDNPNSYKRISKDDFRAMLDNSKYSSDSEKFILQVRDLMITLAIDQGKHVIIDDTNLATKHEDRIRSIVNTRKGKAEVIIQDFTDVPVETCIERDLKRCNSVGEKVIRDMHNQFLKPAIPKIEYDMNLRDAFICDLDGTLALLNGRNPYDASGCENDLWNNGVHRILSFVDLKKIFVSGREEKYREETKKWLSQRLVDKYDLYMRATGDNRKDSIVKKEIYENNIKGKYNIEFVLDDRNQVVEMWRSLGLTCLQVAEGNF